MASWVYDVDCLDDLYRAYYEGQTDYTLFSLLLEAYDTGGLTVSDLEAIGALERNQLSNADSTVLSPFWSRMVVVQKGKVGVRRYSRSQDDIRTSYYADLQARPVSIRFEAEQDDSLYKWDKRWVAWDGEAVDVVVGNYYASEGPGLAIGRFDYRPSAGLDQASETDALFPVNNYYNGLRISSRHKGIGERLYFSQKKYLDARKSFVGLGADINRGQLAFGVAAGYNRFAFREMIDERITAGINVSFLRGNARIAGEFAVTDGAPGLFVSGKRQSHGRTFGAEFWFYDQEFKSYNSSGPSATDYQSFYPAEQELGFRSAQAGETGLALNYAMRPLSLGIMLWTHAATDKINSSYTLSLRQPLTSGLTAFFLSSGKLRQESEYHWFKTGLRATHDFVLSETGVKLYIDDRTDLSHERSYAFASASKMMKKSLKVSLNLRNYFSGATRIYVAEELVSSIGVNISAEATLYNGTRVSVKLEKLL